MNLFAVFPWAAPLSFAHDGSRLESRGGRSHSGNQVRGSLLEARDDLSVSIICIGKKDELLAFTNQGEHFVGLIDQGSLVAIGADNAFMNTRTDRDTEEVTAHTAEDSKCLKGMAHNEMGL